MAVKKKKRGVWSWIKRIFLFLFIFQLLYIIALKWIDPPFTLTQLHSFFRGDGLKRDYIDYEEMPETIKLAVIASEDQIFPDHNGFDWKSIEKAMKYNKKKPGRVRGASTISQQVAKNVFLWQGRDFIRKGLEVYFTQMIEWIWGKRRILEVYLNVIEMGKGIFGIQAASKHFFKKDAKKLTRGECSLIAASLPNPLRYTIIPLHPYVRVKSGWVLRQMNNLQGDKELREIISTKYKVQSTKTSQKSKVKSQK